MVGINIEQAEKTKHCRVVLFPLKKKLENIIWIRELLLCYKYADISKGETCRIFSRNILRQSFDVILSDTKKWCGVFLLFLAWFVHIFYYKKF